MTVSPVMLESASARVASQVVAADTAPTNAGALYTTKCSPKRMSLPYPLQSAVVVPVLGTIVVLISKGAPG